MAVSDTQISEVKAGLWLLPLHLDMVSLRGGSRGEGDTAG